MNTKALFDSRECGRCGGGGRYSWNATDGDVCYGCGGRGWVLTRRGKATQAYYTDLLSANADAIRVGDVVRLSSITLQGRPYTAWWTVEAVAPEANGAVCLTVLRRGRTADDDRMHYHTAPGDRIRVAASAEAKAEVLAKARGYQDTLTEAGTVRKRPARAPRPPTLPPIADEGAWDGPAPERGGVDER